MARTLPDGWEALEASGVASFEIATLRRLAGELPDDYTVFHGVHWTRLDHGYSVYGEIDFLVLGPHGQVVLIEQKSGPLEETPEGLVKRYPLKTKNVPGPIQRSVDALQARFKQAHGGQRLPLDYLLYCPDYRVLNPATAGYFLEVKSRTWSRRDAQDRAAVITQLLERLGAQPDDAVEADYVDL